jgi:RHS repeat-associated protein
MAGDKIDIGVQYFYNSLTGTSGPGLAPTDLLNSLATGLATLSAPLHSSFGTLNSPNSSPLLAALQSSIANETGDGTSKPKAYLNWVLLDNQFNYVGGNNQSAAMQVEGAGTQSNGQPRKLAYPGISMSKSGYLYIYVSNATPGWDVFFDNLSVTHYSGPLLEEDHYYPFGLTMAGISDKAIKSQYAENKFKFNKGAELQNKEYSDGSGLEMYETHLRELDPQLGRWWQADPKTDQSYENVSPYSAMNDNPIRFNDVNGDEGEDCCGLTFTWDNVKANFNQDVQNVKNLFSTAGDNLSKRWDAGVTFPQEFVKNPMSAVTGVGGPVGIVVEGLEMTSAAKAGGNIVENAANGKKFETVTKQGLVDGGHTDIAEQVTVKADNGVKTRVDFISKDPQGKVALTEAKASQTAPLTKNQKAAHPSIEQDGGTVVGKGKSGYEGGTKIPPTKVNVVRKTDN